MPAPSNTTVYDDFNRANGAVGGTLWGTRVQSAVAATLQVIGNLLGVTSAAANGVTAASFGPATDLVLDCVTPPNNGSYIAIWWALANTGGSAYTGMALVMVQNQTAGNAQWQLRRYSNGSSSPTTLASASVANLAAGDRIWINSDGSGVHTFYVARAAAPNTWTQVLTFTDATYNRAGTWAIELGDGTSRWDNLSGGTVTAGALTVSPGGIASAEAWGSASVQPGAVSATPVAIASSETFGATTAAPGAVTTSAPAIMTAETFGATTIQPGPVSASFAGIPSSEAWGAATVTSTPASAIEPLGIPSTEAFGSTQAVPGLVPLTPTGIPSRETFGSPTMAAGAVTLTPAGIASSEAFGSWTVTADQPLQATVAAAIASSEAWGSSTIQWSATTPTIKATLDATDASPPAVAVATASGRATAAVGARAPGVITSGER